MWVTEGILRPVHDVLDFGDSADVMHREDDVGVATGLKSPLSHGSNGEKDLSRMTSSLALVQTFTQRCLL